MNMGSDEDAIDVNINTSLGLGISCCNHYDQEKEEDRHHHQKKQPCLKHEHLLFPCLTLSLSPDENHTNHSSASAATPEHIDHANNINGQLSPDLLLRHQHQQEEASSTSLISNSSSMVVKRGQKDGVKKVEVEVIERSVVSVSVSMSMSLSSKVLKISGHEDEEAAVAGSPRKKLRLTKQQSATLEDAYKQQTTLNPKQKQLLAAQLNLRPRQVEVWFQNRRARTKLKHTEEECEELKKRCETLREENKRLHKELQELKLTTSFYMHLQPAPTLAICPSCEKITGSTTSASDVVSSLL